MAHNPHAHLQREIDSLRKQLIQERDTRRYDEALHVTSVIKQAEGRVLERCIVECMEEANAPTYTEEERIAILTAAERLKEMRAERQHEREEREKTRAYDLAINQAMISGTSYNHVWLDDNTTGGLK